MQGPITEHYRQTNLSYGSKEKTIWGEFDKGDWVGRPTLPDTDPLRGHASTAAVMFIKVELDRLTSGGQRVSCLPHLNHLARRQ